MMQQGNPWENDTVVPAGSGVIITKHPGPKFKYEDGMGAAGLQEAQLRAHKAASETPYDADMAKAARDSAVANAAIATAKAKEAQFAATPIDPKLDQLTGNDYSQQLPAAIRAQAQALIDGRMGFPTGAALRSPYWQQMIQHVSHIDPTFDAVNYNARSATRRSFTSGKDAANITSLNTAIGHLAQLNGQIDGTASHGGLPGATLLNAFENGVARSAGAPGVTNYEQTAGAVASELTQVFRGSGGAEADIKRELGNLDASGSLAQKQGAVRNIAGLLKSRLDALDDKYQQGMGTTAAPLQILNHHAQAGYDMIGKLGGGGPPSAGGGDGGPSGVGGPGTPGAPGLLATGAKKNDKNPAREKALDSLIRSGADMATINAVSGQMGGQDLDAKQVADWQKLLKQHPDYQGPITDSSVAEPTTAWNRFTASPTGTGIYSAVDGAMGGTSDELTALLGGGDLADINARKQAAFAENPKSAFAGQMAGSIAGMIGVGKVGTAIGLGKKALLAADIGYNAFSGAGQDNDNRTMGAIVGALTAGAGHGLGAVAAKPIGALARTGVGSKVNDIARLLADKVPGVSAPPITRAAALTPAEQSVQSTVAKAGTDKVAAALANGSSVGVPLALADVAPSLGELAGAAARRSPAARDAADAILTPRSQGQIGRMGDAVEQNLGPIGNTLEISRALSQQAKTDAAPLYDIAHSTPTPSTPELDSLLNTPFGRESIGKAKTIAANERTSPTELGFALGEDGQPVLNPQPNASIAKNLFARQELNDAQDAYRQAKTMPGSMDAATARLERARQGMRDAGADLSTAPDPSAAASVPTYTTQSLDYAKQGMDDVLEQYRNQITNRLELTPAGRAQNLVKNQLLGEIDRVNPAYADARAAYQGPMESMDALHRGQDFHGSSINANQISDSIANATPEHVAQMQLGYRDSMMGKADQLSYSTNPWNTLNNPAAEAKLAAMHPGADDQIAALLNQRNLERDMAGTNTRVIGGSQTAGRQIADEQFMPSAGTALAIDGVTALAGGVPVATATRALTSSSMMDGLKARLAAGANAKAEALIPMLLNTNPDASSAIVNDLMEKAAARDAYRRATTPGGAFSLAGAGVGMASADALQR